MLSNFEYNESDFIPATPQFTLEELVNTKLPPSPSNVMNLTRLLEDVNTSTRKISDAISYEPALVARFLRLANSPIYSPENPIISISGAINIIGLQAIHDILMMELASVTFSREIRNSVIAKQIWEHSLAVAIISREIGKTMGMHGVEEAFTCGLLHDFGKFIFLCHDVIGFSQLLDKHDEIAMLTAEKEYFGYTHAEVGACVVQKWNLRDEIYSTILCHHNPSESKHAVVITHIVAVADMLANINGYGLRLDTNCSLENSESVAKLRISEEKLQEIWEKSQHSISEVISTFM